MSLFATVGKSRGSPIQIHYELHGHGNEKVMFIMGFLTTLDGWKLQVEYLKEKYADQYTFCVFDNRGVGKSDSPAFNYTSEHMAMDAIDLAQHLKWDKIHLIGMSMGGMIALEFASIAPHLISTLTLSVTHAGGFGRFAPFSGMKGMLKSFTIRDNRERGKVLMPILYSSKYLDQMNDEEPHRKNFDVLVDDYVSKVETSPPPKLGALVGHIRTVYTHHLTDKRLSAIKDSGFPILIMCGDVDHMVRTSNSFLLRDLLNPIEFIQFDAGHCINVEHKQEFNDALLRHWARSSNTPPNTTPTLSDLNDNNNNSSSSSSSSTISPPPSTQQQDDDESNPVAFA